MDEVMSGKARVLVVDDEERNLRLMEAMLLPLGYEVLLAKDGEQALGMVKTSSPDIVLLDVMMPHLDGFEVAKKLQENEETKVIPIVMVTALKEVEDKVKALEVGADDFLSKPVEKVELRARVSSLLKVKAYNDHMLHYQKKLEEEVNRRTEELKQAFDKIKAASLDTILRLSKAAEFKDEDTGDHIQRMSRYCAAVARHMGLDDVLVENLLYASPMHDVGKIGIPDRILLKPGTLNADEWEIMKMHTIIGAEILSGGDAEFIKMGEVIAHSHHEKWDGNGYPDKLKGKDIPLVGRIAAIADVFDALISRRPYKEPFPLDKSLAIIKEGRGSHFDPDVNDAFFDIEDEIVSITKEIPSVGESPLIQLARKSGAFNG